MRLNIRHETAYRYATPANRAIEVLRLLPRGHNGQYIAAWRIDMDCDCRLDPSTDAFGNLMYEFTLDGPISALTIVAEGSVETTDTAGVLSGQVERFPPVLYLRDTALTASDALIRDFADEVAAKAGGDRLGLMHALMDALAERMRFEVDATSTGTSAVEAFALGHGVCQDFAHVFIAACRHLRIPARFTAGYMLNLENPPGRRRAMPGRRCSSRASAGWASIRPTPCARPTPMCGWPSGWIISVRRRCAASSSAAAANPSPAGSTSAPMRAPAAAEEWLSSAAFAPMTKARDS